MSFVQLQYKEIAPIKKGLPHIYLNKKPNEAWLRKGPFKVVALKAQNGFQWESAHPLQ